MGNFFCRFFVVYGLTVLWIIIACGLYFLYNEYISLGNFLEKGIQTWRNDTSWFVYCENLGLFLNSGLISYPSAMVNFDIKLKSGKPISPSPTITFFLANSINLSYYPGLRVDPIIYHYNIMAETNYFVVCKIGLSYSA